MLNSQKVLWVFSDRSALNYFEKMASGYGFEPLSAASLKEGLIYAWRDRPEIIIFDVDLKDMAALAFVQKIHRDARTENTLLIAVGSDRNFQTESDFIASGCLAYLHKSPQLINQLMEFFMNPAAASLTFNRAQGYQIVFLSAKGGVGTSSLCANLADSLARTLQAQRETTEMAMDDASPVCVLDLVLPIGSIAPIVGYNGDENIVSLASTPPEQLNKFFVNEHLVKPERWAFNLLPGAPDPEQAAALSVGRIPLITDILRRSFDYVFIDLGRSLSRISLPVILEADLVVLIVGSDLSAARLSKVVIDYLIGKHLQPERLFIVLNRAVGLEGLTREEIKSLLEYKVQLSVPYMRDNLTVSNNQNMPLLMKYPSNTMAFIMKDGAKKIMKTVHVLREARDHVGV